MTLAIEPLTLRNKVIEDFVLQLHSVFGYLVFIFLAWLMSSHRRHFPWRIVIIGSLMQFGIAILILKTSAGLYFFQSINAIFDRFLACVDAGSEMLFEGVSINLTGDYMFAFRVLPTIIVFSALTAALYHLRVMQPIVAGMAYVTQRLLRTSGAETLSGCANIFLGQTEAPLVIRPYMPRLTISELNSVMIGGFANISGSLIAAFSGMGVPAADLVTASVISCPAGLLIAKVMLPELENPETMGTVKVKVDSEAANLLEAVAIGTSDGRKLALNVSTLR